MSMQVTTDEQKRQIAQRLSELNGDRDDLKRQRNLCLEDIARCDRELSRPTFREHVDIVREQRRESGNAIQLIDAELGKIKAELHTLNCLVNFTLDDYFMNEARKILPPAIFDEISRKAREVRNSHLSIIKPQPIPATA